MGLNSLGEGVDTREGWTWREGEGLDMKGGARHEGGMDMSGGTGHEGRGWT